MKLKRISYKIAMEGFLGCTLQDVTGYACDTPYRLCVRHTKRGWVCDDFDTGRGIGPSFAGRVQCVNSAIGIIEQNGSQLYAKRKKQALARLKKAGLL